ncbi:MAG: hypothetical protein VKP70_12255 [Cyanobacteriota bacterium]|nr:hypothetical protein [Cyanobacteriota bacterium]
MSQLRTIMQKLAQGQGSDQPGALNGVNAEVMRLHVADYQRALQGCTAPMLQYEWAWLEDHLDNLHLCLSQPGMLEAMGGKAHVDQLLAESLQCQEVLRCHMAEQQVEPASHWPTMPTSDHAWELCQEKTKQLWGIQP